jgi:hypothetical protein
MGGIIKKEKGDIKRTWRKGKEHMEDSRQRLIK